MVFSLISKNRKSGGLPVFLGFFGFFYYYFVDMAIKIYNEAPRVEMREDLRTQYSESSLTEPLFDFEIGSVNTGD